jgi:signal transduction histidine kinase
MDSFDPRQSIAARLVLGYGLLAMLSMIGISAVFYFGTVGVIDYNIDQDLRNQGSRLSKRLQSEQAPQLAREVDRQLNDGIDSDREIYLVLAADGRRLAGNLSTWPPAAGPFNTIVSADVVRNGVSTRARLMAFALSDGGRFIIGDDLRELSAMQAMVLRALAWGALLSLGLTMLGAALFRQQIARRISEVRATARVIAAGDLSQRIPHYSQDEFGLLNHDINIMLDRIEQLMHGVRDVSNAIAHDLRTPLTRIRTKLESANRRAASVASFRAVSMEAIEDIDELIRLFECLLQIAQAEAGVGASSFAVLELADIAGDIAEMYDSTVDEGGMRLHVRLSSARVRGDRNLIATALSSLIENAIKYAAGGERIEVGVAIEEGKATLSVRDYGPGIPEQELDKVSARFYRLDKARQLPGHGLGLSIVTAIVNLHGGTLVLENAAPGLRARILLPLAPAE